MGRTPCCSKVGLNRGAWTAMEDKILRDYIKVQGEGKWRDLPERAGLKRCGKSCRLRWLNYLRPDIKRGNITRDEEELLIRLHNLLGNRWSLIAGRLPGRTDNEIKNYWNTYLGKKLRSGHQSSDHDLAATSINTTSSDPSKTTSSNKTLHKLRRPSLNKRTPSRSTAQQLVELPYSKSKTTTPSYVPAVRTKANRLTKVTLLPDQDPQNPPPLNHDNSSKPAVDTVQPPPSTVNDKVNKIYANDQMVAGTGLDHDHHDVDHDRPLVPISADDESNNSSQLFMAHINQDHDYVITEDHEKFLSDFLNIECLALEFANMFGNGEHDSCNNIFNKGFEDDTLLFSDQDHVALFGLSATELQSGTISTTTTTFSD